jgi:hypothetical protein
MLILPVAPAACPDQLAVYHGCPRTPNGDVAGKRPCPLRGGAYALPDLMPGDRATTATRCRTAYGWLIGAPDLATGRFAHAAPEPAICRPRHPACLGER